MAKWNCVRCGCQESIEHDFGIPEASRAKIRQCSNCGTLHI